MRLEAGQRAHWSPSSKEVWCIDCASGEGSSVQVASDNIAGDSRNTATNATPSGSSSSKSAANSGQTPWQQLCNYAQRCIEAEAAKSLVPYVKKNSLWFLHRGEEKLVVGQSDSTPAPGELPDKLRSRTGSIIYGWPTIVVTDRDHTPKVAPLFAVQIEPEQGPDNQWELHATMEPEFNLAITASGIFGPFDHRRHQRPVKSRIAVRRCRRFWCPRRTNGRPARASDIIASQRENPRIEHRSQTRHLQRRDFGRGRVVWIYQHPS